MFSGYLWLITTELNCAEEQKVPLDFAGLGVKLYGWEERNFEIELFVRTEGAKDSSLLGP